MLLMIAMAFAICSAIMYSRIPQILFAMFTILQVKEAIYRASQIKGPMKQRFFLNMKITRFEMNMNIIMWSKYVSQDFFPVNFGASITKL